jgi:hypothetical protein
MKTEKELAFIDDLFISEDWTRRFTAIVDEHMELTAKGKLLYYNSGSGTHALELGERLDKDAEITAVSETPELKNISRAKQDAIDADESRKEQIHAEINFVTEAPDKIFDAVLADASFVRPNDLTAFIERMSDFSEKEVAVFLPTAGSFGEIFSFLWETLFNADLPEYGAEIERLIEELPTVSRVEEIFEDAGLRRVQSFTKNEIFEFENGKDFTNSPLIEDFFLPVWLEFLNENDEERVRQKLAQTVDDEDGTMTFRFSVKATLTVGEKS